MDKTKFSNTKEIRKFALYLGVFLLLLGIAQMLFGRKFFGYFYVASLCSLLAGLFAPKLVKPVFIVFSYASFYLGRINSTILLGVFFYLVLTPVAWVMRLAKKDSLGLKVKKEAKTYWIVREKGVATAEDFKNQF